MLESAVRSLRTMTDEMPLLDALQGLFPMAGIVKDSVVTVYVELIDLCSDCISIFARKWYGKCVPHNSTLTEC